MRWNSGRRTWQAGIIVALSSRPASPSSGRNPSGRQHAGHHPRTAGGGSATALPRPSCGWIGVRLINGTAPPLVASHGALACFNRAARDCTAASISDTLMDVAAGTSYGVTLNCGGPDILIPATVTVKSPAVTPW
jgi:hypothetical protein